MADVVLDASAVLALLNNEPGAEHVAKTLPGAIINAVNMAEVYTRLLDWGVTREEITEIIDALGMTQLVFDQELAWKAASLRPATRVHGLSLGDRACLAQGLALNGRVLTADRQWLALNLPVAIDCIRPEKEHQA